MAGFTLVELLTAAAVSCVVTLALLSFSSTALRLIARNLTTNHSHEVMRISNLQLQRDLHDAACPFRLIDFDGTNYTDAAPAPSADQDPFTQRWISTRSNGVRFRRLAGGPYQLTASTKSTSTKLTFDFSNGSSTPYVPQVGDKIVIPLIAREYDISAVHISPKPGSTSGTVSISDPDGIGYTIDAVTAGNITTAYFYREVAYTVYGNELRFHPNFNGNTKDTYTVLRDRVTSPKPFSVLFNSVGDTVTDGLELHVSMESYDTSNSARRFINGTATFQAVVPSRTQPTPVSSTNAS